MYYKLIKELPKHDIGELVYLSSLEDSSFYEWVENPNYLLPRDIVEDSDDFFEQCFIDWEIGEPFVYVNSFGVIIEQIFNPKAHLKLVLAKNAFKNKDNAEWFLKNCDKLLSNDIIICNSEHIFKIKELLLSKDKLKIEKILHLLDLITK